LLDFEVENMPYISTWVNGSEQHHNVDVLPTRCPFCDRKIHPDFRCAITKYFGNGFTEPYAEILEAVFQCPADDCQHLFIVMYDKVSGHPEHEYFFASILPKNQSKKTFDQYIEDLSPSFCSIWNQAYQAEQSGLKDICGPGYRKALEYLIKDYLISQNPNKREYYQSKLLGNCIRDDIKDPRIKACAERAAWLGNDEVHYDKKWKGKEVKDLKTLIELSLHWILMEHLTGTYETDMQ